MTITHLSLGKNDAAIILRSDGTFETSLPQIESETIPDNAMMGAALAYALQNPEICDVILKNFYITSSQMDNEQKPSESPRKSRKFVPSIVT
jgi:hypothetical protein